MDILGTCGSYLRTKVEFKVDEPLCRGTWMMSQKNETYWISFKYERLFALCFRCDMLNHTIKGCKKEEESED